MPGKALVLAILLFLPAAAAAQPLAIDYAIEATVSDRLDRIEGRLEAKVRNQTGAPLDALVLWRYPELFRGDLPGITDANRTFYAPFAANDGALRLRGLRVDGEEPRTEPLDPALAPPETALAIRLPRPLAPGATAVVSVEFTTVVPHRLGPFSRADGVLTALGGWHPYLTAPTDEPLEQRPPPAAWEIALHLPAGHLALIGGRRLREGPVHLVEREWADLVVRKADVRPLHGRGGAVWPLANEPWDEWEKASLPDPPPLGTSWVGDDLAQLLAAMDRWADGEPNIPDPGPIQLVVVPMDAEVALATPGIVAVSDRAYQVTPLRFIQNFHAMGIARAYFARRFLPLVRRCETPGMAPQIADALGALYAYRFVDEELGGAGDVLDVLGRFDFLPSVDDFLRSRRAAFAHLYLEPVADPIPVRDEPWTFNNPAPRGKLLFTKLQDWLEPEPFEQLIARYVAGEVCPLQRGAEAIAGEPLDAFFAAWAHRRQAEDLRVRIVSTARLPDGTWQSVVEVRRVGDTPPERIEIMAWDRAGRSRQLVWRAAAGEVARTFTIEGDEPITRLRVDPRGRVPQTPAEPGEIAALGDRVPPNYQLLLTRFTASYSAADASFFGDVDFLLRPRDAVRRRLGFGASYRKARVAVRSRLTFGFGPLVDAARYAWNWGIGLSGDYLRAGFGGDATAEGFAVGPSVGISYDDRPYFSPLRGTAFSAGFSVNVGANRGGESAIYTGLSAGVLRFFPLGPRSTIAVRLKGNAVLGSPPIQELIPLGGSDEGLRGLPLEAVLSSRRAVASAEWRHPLAPDIDVDVGLARLRNVTGAFFVDGAVVGEIFTVLPNRPEHAFFADAGYGLRFEYDLGGVRPLILAVDAAVPINRSAAIDAPPVLFTVRAGQSFAGP